MIEATLIAAARLGDQDAFAELYQQHVQQVRMIGWAVLPVDDLDDFCQDTFLLAFTRLHGFQETSSFRTWITRIALNQCMKIRRREQQASNGAANLVPLDTAIASGKGREPSDFQLGKVAARLDLERMMRVLRPAQRRLLEMAYVDELPEADIAKILGVGISTVKRRIVTAKEKMQRNPRF